MKKLIMDRASCRIDIIQLLEKISPYAEIDERTQLLDEGVLDSMSVLALVTLLEDSFDIEIPDEAITRENFETIENVISLIEILRGEA